MYLIWHNSMVIMAQVNFGVCKAMDDKKDKEGVVQWITRRVSGSGTEPACCEAKHPAPLLERHRYKTNCWTRGRAAKSIIPSIVGLKPAV
jgi:hypothetical protein